MFSNLIIFIKNALQRQKEEKMLLLKEQRETEQKIQDLLHFIADVSSNNSSSPTSSSCL